MTSRVLYVDDNESNAKLVRVLLEARGGIEVMVAGNAAEGLTLARNRPPDLVLVDLYLPDMRGDDLLRELKGDEATAGVPTVVVSAEDDSQVVREVLDAGASAYVTKPFEAAALLRLIGELLAPSAADRN